MTERDVTVNLSPGDLCVIVNALSASMSQVEDRIVTNRTPEWIDVEEHEYLGELLDHFVTVIINHKQQGAA